MFVGVAPELGPQPKNVLMMPGVRPSCELSLCTSLRWWSISPNRIGGAAACAPVVTAVGTTRAALAMRAAQSERSRMGFPSAVEDLEFTRATKPTRILL